MEGVTRNFATLTEMLAQCPDVAAVAINTPPQVRRSLAVEAIAAGKAVLLEKPPASTISELADMEDRAAAGEVPCSSPPGTRNTTPPWTPQRRRSRARE